MALTEGESRERQVRVLCRRPVALEGHAKDDGTFDKRGGRFAHRRAQLKSSEKLDREKLGESGCALECPDGNRRPDPS